MTVGVQILPVLEFNITIDYDFNLHFAHRTKLKSYNLLETVNHESYFHK